MCLFRRKNKDNFQEQPPKATENKESNLDKTKIEKIKQLQSVYEIAIRTREFEISQLIQRNNFFMLFQGVFLAAVFQNQASKPYIEFWLSLLGIFISIYQTQVAAGAKYWQEYWEVRLGDIEEKLKKAMKTSNNESFFEPLFPIDRKDPIHQKTQGTLKKKTKEKYNGPFSKIPNHLILKGKYSVSRVPIIAGITLTLFWFAIFAQTISINHNAFEALEKITKLWPLKISGHHFTEPPKTPQQTTKPTNIEVKVLHEKSERVESSP